jgi:hypothetical protein
LSNVLKFYTFNSLLRTCAVPGTPQAHAAGQSARDARTLPLMRGDYIWEEQKKTVFVDENGAI